MINSNNIVQLDYLLDPCFQIENSAGRPNTDGYIEVYISGSRVKYYCASDFNGTLHPFQIPLNSLGANVVLADPNKSFDVYVYNKYGSLIMSRYNVKCGGSGASSTTNKSAEHWLGQYGASRPLDGEGYGITLPLPNTVDYTGEFIDHIEDTSVYYEDPDHGIISYNAPGYIYLKPGLYLVNCVIRLDQKQGTEANRLSEMLIYTGNGNANEDGAWQIDESGPWIEEGSYRHTVKLTFIRKVLAEGERSDVDCSNSLYFAPAPLVQMKEAYIQTLQIVKLDYGVVAGGGSGGIYTAGWGININDEGQISVVSSIFDSYSTLEQVNTIVSSVSSVLQSEIESVQPSYTPGQYINIEDGVISVTGLQPAGDYATNSDVYAATVTAVQTATGLIPDVSNLATNTEVYDATVTAIQAATSVIPEQYSAGQYISIDNNVISVTGLQPEGNYLVSSDLNGYATESYVTSQGYLVSSDLSNYATQSFVTSQGYLVSSDLNGYATQSYVTSQGYATETQVNEAIVTAINYVTGNIPEQYSAGQYVNITNNVISVTGLQPSGNYLVPSDLNGYATQNWVNNQGYLTSIPSEYATETEVNSAIVTAINYVTGNYPEQVQSDWAQTVTSAVDYIKNKPDETPLIPGNGITMTASGNGVIIAANVTADTQYTAGQYVNITSNVISVTGLQVAGNYLVSSDLSDYATETFVTSQGYLTAVPSEYATETEVNSAIVTAINYVTGNIPEQVQSNWTQTVTSAADYIKNKPAETNLTAGNGIELTSSGNDLIISCNVTGAIPAEQLQSDWAQTNTSAVDYIKHKPQEVNLAAGDGITITASGSDIVVACNVTGGPSYTAGQYVNIANNVISVTGLQPSGNYLVSSDLNGYATQSFVTSQGYLVSSDLSNYATESDVNSAIVTAVNYVTSNYPEQVQSNWLETNTSSKAYIQNKPQDLIVVAGSGISIVEGQDSVVISCNVTGVATESFVTSQGYLVSSDLNSYATQNWVTSQGYLTSVPSNYATQNWVTNQGYLTSVPSEYATETEVNAAIVTAIDAATSVIPDQLTAGNYIDITNNVINVTGLQPSGNYLVSSDLNGYATESYVTSQGYLTAVPSEYTTETEVNTAIVTAINYVTSNFPDQLTAGQYISINNNVINVTGLQPAGNYLVSSDLNGYATESFVTSQGYLVSSNLSEYAKESWVTSQGYLTSIPANYATDSEVNAATVTAINYVTSNFPTQVQSDWSQTVTSAVDYIKNKPTQETVELIPIMAGNGITISASGTSAIISCNVTGGGGGTTYTAGDHIGIVNDEISVTGITDLVAGNAITITASGTSAIISSTGEAQVQANWNETNTSSKAYIQNKPTIPAAQVQSNWNETNTSSKAYIQNKPTIPNYSGASGVAITNDTITLDNPIGLVPGSGIDLVVSGASAIISCNVTGGGSVQIQSDWAQTVTSAVDYIKNKPTAETVELMPIIAASGIEITTSGTSAIISASGIMDILGDVETALASSINVVTSMIPTTINPLITANISDIQVVTALPQSPVSGVLYLIPEA